MKLARWIAGNRRQVFLFLERPQSVLGYAYHAAVMLMLLASAILDFISTDASITEDISATSVYSLEVACLVVNVTEYIVRLSCGSAFAKNYQGLKGFWTLVTSPLRIVELVICICSISIVAYCAPDQGRSLYDSAAISYIRLLSVVRLIRFERYLHSTGIIIQLTKKNANEILASSFLAIFLLVFFAVIMYSVENGSQPEVFSSVTNAMYYTWVTMATLGYGDITPSTSAGRAVCCIIILTGMIIVAAPGGILGASLALRAQEDQNNYRFRTRLNHDAANLIECAWRLKKIIDPAERVEALKRLYPVAERIYLETEYNRYCLRESEKRMSRIGTPDTLEQFIDHYHQRCKESPELDDKYQKYCKSSLAEGKKPLSLREYVHRYSREDKESIQFSDVPKFVLNPISVHLLYYIQFYMALRAYKTASKLHSHDLQDLNTELNMIRTDFRRFKIVTERKIHIMRASETLYPHGITAAVSTSKFCAQLEALTPEVQAKLCEKVVNVYQEFLEHELEQLAKQVGGLPSLEDLVLALRRRAARVEVINAAIKSLHEQQPNLFPTLPTKQERAFRKDRM